jgi:hypothetical protein
MGPNGDRLLASELHHDPYPLFARLRREAPVWQLPGENAYLVSTWDLVAEATSRVQDSPTTSATPCSAAMTGRLESSRPAL